MTSILSMLPKEFLGFWRAKLAAELAVDSLDFISRMAEADREGAVKYLSGAAGRYTKARASIGSEAHDLFERMIRGEDVGRQRSDLEPYRLHFAEFLATVQPELAGAEDIAWSDTHQYAGSFDVMMWVWLRQDDFGTLHVDRVNGVRTLIMGDWKTSKATYPDVALQLSAYEHADKIIHADGTESPMPEFGGSAVLHITADQWSFKPVRTDDAVFRVFLALREVFDWDRDLSKDVIGRPLASGGGGIVTGTQRRGK
ncbi:hypothetical protein [Streptomyces avermitilis]|uniref:hypothetical protein n=1 Tax=Streptomyces avermitilis TaxID=33903 RepID=UPI0037FEE959